MSDHSQYEELAALAAGGYLDDEELRDFQRHAESCAQCKNAVAQFGELIHFGLPLVEGRVRRIGMPFRIGPDARARTK